MNSKNLEKNFRKNQSCLFTLGEGLLKRDIPYFENNPKQYDIVYDLNDIDEFKYNFIFEIIARYINLRNYYIPNTIIIKNNDYLENGVYVYSYTENKLFRINKINSKLYSMLDDNNFYITFYTDIHYAIYVFGEKAFSKSAIEMGILLGLIYEKSKNCCIQEYNYNIYTFPKMQGIDVTLFAQGIVLGVKNDCLY